MPDETADSLAVQPLESDAEIEGCARLMASSEPWITLHCDLEASRRFLSDPSRERYVARIEGKLAGFLILNMKGPFVGYLQTICVAPEFQGRGIGTRLVEFAEKRIHQVSPNVFLCVSSFNEGARRLYERLGYKLVGELTDYLVAGHSEMLMRKTLGPISTFTPSESGT